MDATIISKQVENGPVKNGVALQQGTASNQAKLITVAGTVPIGVALLDNDEETVAAGEQVGLGEVGTRMKVLMEGTIAAGGSIGVTVGGLGVASSVITTAATGKSEPRLATALEAGVNGDMVEAIIKLDFINVNP